MSLRSGILALARASGEAVLDGDAGGATGRYAVLYTSAGVLSGDDVAFTPNLSTIYFQITSIGPRNRDPEVVATRVRDALVGQIPTASGWVCGPVVHLSSQASGRDEDRPDETIFFSTDQYELLAARA